jgi:GAF domain-containing protein
VNGDPSLDVGFACESLRSCLAIPLTTGDKLLGVLTLYSEHEQAFDARAERVAQSLAPYLTTWIESASRATASATHPSLPEIARSARTMGESAATRRPH